MSRKGIVTKQKIAMAVPYVPSALKLKATESSNETIVWKNTNGKHSTY